jgi:glucuronate isomerase
MLPAFRPDKALTVNQPAGFNQMGGPARPRRPTWTSMALRFPGPEKRHDFFHSQGCRLSDHGMNHCFADFCSEKTAAAIFDKARQGQAASPPEHVRSSPRS